jgi:ADP-heptose:LPS heptosyltransferase
MPDSIVIQWSRLGDVLQTRVLLQRLKHEGERVILCCDATYAKLAELFPEVDEVWPVDLSQLASLAKHRLTHPEFLEVLTTLLPLAEPNETQTAFVLSRSLPAALFAEMLQPKAMRGYTRSKDELRTPPQLVNLEQCLREGIQVPLHIADVWASYAGHSSNAQWLKPLCHMRPCDTRGAFQIALVCDTGEKNRMIPEVWLANLLEQLLSTEELSICLIGAEAASSSSPLSSVANKHTKRVNDLRANTGLMQAAELLSEQDLVIGSDSGGLHLAAAFGLPVIGLYFGGAHCLQTGPYARSAIVFQEPEWSEHTVNEVSEVVGAAIQCHGDFTGVGKDTDLWRPALDEFGLMYECLASEGEDRRKAQQLRRSTLKNCECDCLPLSEACSTSMQTA